MPTVRRPAAVLLLTGAGVLLVPTGARADGLRIDAPAAVDVGAPAALSVSADLSEPNGRLIVVTRPVTGAPCGSSEQADYEADPTSWREDDGQLLEGRVVVLGAGPSTTAVDHAFTVPGRRRICAWVTRAGTTPAAGTAELEVRGTAGTVRIDRFRQYASTSKQVLLDLDVSGRASTPADVRAWVVPAGASCPGLDVVHDRDGVTVLRRDGGPLQAGSFSTTFRTSSPLAHGRWQACVALGDGGPSGQASVVAHDTATVRTGQRPRYLASDRPRVIRAGSTLRCRRGTWRAEPAPTFRYAWRHDGRTVAGAHRSRLRVSRTARGRWTCVVTAHNRAGTTTVRTLAVGATG
ncbi:hypothetical protein [Patulibacter minatonensis]|uniref:hypothetical protein n=1 Tax=Patulibacter minatonensis TaxID=298163 RepID=UPI00047E7B83|nr:hypothetical protein [Patulibacter minatonensis]